MYRTPTTKTNAMPSTSKATDSPKNLRIDQTPKRPDRALTQIIKRRPTTPVTPVPEMNMANLYNKPCPKEHKDRSVEEEIKKAEHRYEKMKELLKRSRNLKREIYQQAMQVLDEMYESTTYIGWLFYEQQEWIKKQRDNNADEYEKIQNTYLEMGIKKQTLRRELSGLKDKLDKETAEISTQTDNIQMTIIETTHKETQTDSTTTTATNEETHIKQIGEKQKGKRTKTDVVTNYTQTETLQMTKTGTTQTKEIRTSSRSGSTQTDLPCDNALTSQTYQIDTHMTLLKQNIESNEKLRLTIERNKNKLDQDKTVKLGEKIDQLIQMTKDDTSHRNTDRIWTRQKTQIKQPVLYSLVVAPTDTLRPSWTADNVATKIREVLDAKSGGVEVDKIRKAKDAKVIVSCRTVEARSKIREKLNKVKDELLVEEMKNKDPLIILRDVSKHNTDEDIVEALKRQNKEILKNSKKQTCGSR